MNVTVSVFSRPMPPQQTILDQSLLGATGDIGTALALDASGNVYVTGTTTSNALDATPGAAIPSRTDATTNSFLAKYDADLNLDFVTFTGGSRIAASALAVTPDAIFVTGSLFSATLPITASAFQQSPATGSTQNGFVERFSSDGTTLLYATYLTGTGGNTTPTAIAADSSDAAYIAGSTTASGYPTAAALVPTILSNPSGFLTKITPAGDAASFSTFIPGPGLSSIALDASGQSLFLSGSIALGQFPVETVAAPIARLPYQTLLKLPLDGSSVQDSILLAPGTQSFLAPDSTGAIWVDQTLPAALLPTSTLSPFGDVLALHITVQQTMDQAARFGGLPNGNPSFASIPAILTSIAIDASGEPVIAGSVQPTASSSLLATETYDLPLNNALTSVLPSTVRSAELSAATCSGSLCAGSAAYLAKLDPATAAPSLAASVDDSPFIVLRNLGSAPATNLVLTTAGVAFSTNCPVMLPAAAECNLLLSGGGGGPATLTISAANVTPQTIPVPAFTSPASTIVVSPGELDFGIQTSTSPPALRSFTVTNLGSTTQTFSSSALAPTGTASPFSQASTDCAPGTDPGYASLAPAATCKITLAFTASPDPTSDVYLRNYWQIGSRDILLTGYSQAASLSISAAEIDFGTQYPNVPHLPRYLHLSNASTFPVAHAPVSLPGSSPFTVVDACPSLIPAQSVCTLRLDYVPTAVPSEDSTILTLDRDGIGEDLTVLVTGQTLPTPGTPTLPNGSLTISPSSITFTAPAAVTTVSAELHTVTIANTGSSSILLTFSVTGDFVAQSTCPAALTPGQNCIISVNFAPSQPGERLGLVTVSSGPGFSPTYIPITGTGTAILPAENDTLNLGATLLNQPITVFYLVTHAFPSLTASATGPYTVTLIPNLGFGPGNPTNFAPSVTDRLPQLLPRHSLRPNHSRSAARHSHPLLGPCRQPVYACSYGRGPARIGPHSLAFRTNLRHRSTFQLQPGFSVHADQPLVIRPTHHPHLPAPHWRLCVERSPDWRPDVHGRPRLLRFMFPEPQFHSYRAWNPHGLSIFPHIRWHRFRHPHRLRYRRCRPQLQPYRPCLQQRSRLNFDSAIHHSDKHRHGQPSDCRTYSCDNGLPRDDQLRNSSTRRLMHHYRHFLPRAGSRL